ncbi:MAG: ABC transporter ATP-binding protein [Pseudomonadota bacterium]
MPLIEFKNITKQYQATSLDHQMVLKGISFKINEGEFMSIMGPSGSGKSTCMNIIGCLDKPTSGQYLLNGVDISTLSNDDLAQIRNQTLGFVFQNFNLLAKRDLIDNVALPLVYRGASKNERTQKARELLEKVKLKGYEHYYPGQLSGGMKQRVAIARALASQPKIILADEATGNLDTKTSHEIMDLFKELNQKNNITVIMITHEADIAKMTSRCIKVRDGLIEYDGVINE